MCFRIFILCGWADGFTIILLPPYLLAMSLGSWQISWVAAIRVRLQMMSRCIG